MTDQVNVGATALMPTHHVSLTDGVTTLGLMLSNARGDADQKAFRPFWTPKTSLKTSSGDSQYSDFEMPYTPVTQKSWSGGRGLEDIEGDKTRYSDNFRVDTSKGDVILGPTATSWTAPETTHGASTGGTEIIVTTSAAHTFVASATKTFVQARLKLRCASAVGTPVEVQILNAAGSSVISYGNKKLYNTDVEEIVFSIAASLTSGTTYQIKVVPKASDKNVYLTYNAGASGKTMTVDGATVNTAEPYYLLSDDTTRDWKLFQYRGLLYAVSNTGGAPRLFMNGHRAVFSSMGASGFEINFTPGSPTLTGNKFGGVMTAISGKCANLPVNWGQCAAAEIYSPISMLTTFSEKPDTTTELTINGVGAWQELTGHGLTAPVTDVLVTNEIVYFAQGESVNIRRFRHYNNAGTITAEYADDGTNKATFLRLVPTTNGTYKVWKFNNPTDMKPTAAYAATAAWGVNLDFTTKPAEITGDWPIPCGNSGSYIRGVQLYGTPLTPWVMKDDEFGPIGNGVYAPVPIGALRNARSEKNGVASLQSDVYLYFSMLDGVERFYDNRLDDIGPNRDEGLPIGRRGSITKMVEYPGCIYMAVDGGAGYSAILKYVQGYGYHEIYRICDRPITDMAIQVVPGDDIDRLWFSAGKDIYWLPVAMNARKVGGMAEMTAFIPSTRMLRGYSFATTGTLTSCWFNGSMNEVNKFWKKVTLFSENLSAGHRTVTLEYQTDAETTWHTVGTFTTSPKEELALGTYNVTGRRWRYRLTLTTDDAAETPRVKALTVDNVTRVKKTKGYTMTVLADDAAIDLHGNPQFLSATQLVEQLETWADSDSAAAPLTMNHNYGLFDAVKVFIDPESIQTLQVTLDTERSGRLVVAMTVYEA